MPPSDCELSLDLMPGLAEVTIERCADHASAIEDHLSQACHRSFEEGRQHEAAEARQRRQSFELETEKQTEAVLRTLNNAIPQLLKEAETTLKALAVSIAEQFVAASPVDEQRIQHLVEETLREVKDSTKVVIHLHPDDLALIEGSLDRLKATAAHPESIRFQAASHLTRGGCHIDTDFGNLDATIEAKSSRIHSLITEPDLTL